MGSAQERNRTLTFILLRPDGSNRTWQVRRSRVRLAIAFLVLLVLLVAALLALLLLQSRAMQELKAEYQVLEGREIIALSPRPASAEAVPGAASLDSMEAGTPMGMLPGTPSRPTPDSRTTPRGGATTESAVRLEDFRLSAGDPSGNWELNVQLTKRDWDGELLRGFTIIAIEDAAHPGTWITKPPVTMRDGRPISPTTGDSFAIRRLKPLEFSFSIPAGFEARLITILVYDRQGGLLLEQGFPLEQRR